jgi:methylated-DNA-[protein]-cysteine S-methyltransferase
MAGTGAMTASFIFASPIGMITIERSKNGIARVDITADAQKTDANPADELLASARHQVLAYIAGNRKIFDLPLDWSGTTAFQAEVLRLTLDIPFGQVRTYGELAIALGKPAASRAAGGALARNPLPLLIPCHRVVASSGALTGYSAAGGIATKARLLEMEGHRVVGKKLG